MVTFARVCARIDDGIIPGSVTNIPILEGLDRYPCPTVKVRKFCEACFMILLCLEMKPFYTAYKESESIIEFEQLSEKSLPRQSFGGFLEKVRVENHRDHVAISLKAELSSV